MLIDKLKPVIRTTSLLASVMVKQPVIQTGISSVETFDGIKSKIESWITYVKNAVHILGQTFIHIAFSKMVELSFTSAQRLRDHLPCLKWNNLKNELLGLYSTIPFESHAKQTFALLQQGPNEQIVLTLG